MSDEPHVEIGSGTIVVWSDVSCPWAALAVHRLHAAREQLGLEEEVHFDHRAFPLELVNGKPAARQHLQAEIAEIAPHEPGLGWRADEHDDAWPGSVLVALAAVQAAKANEVGGIRASESLDRALRDAFFRDGCTLSTVDEVVAVAEGCDHVDAGALQVALERGEGEDAVRRDAETYEDHGVKGSPHLFLPDGGDVHNPGVTLEQDDDGSPRIAADDPEVYDDLLRRALAPSG